MLDIDPEKLEARRQYRIQREKDKKSHTEKLVMSLLEPIDISKVKTIIQVGLGYWHEGDVLLQHFPNANFYAIEPRKRYCAQARDAGFPGFILEEYLVWSDSNSDVPMFGPRERLSAFSDEKYKTDEWAELDPDSRVVAPAITLDDFCAKCDIPKEGIFLWLDCEGSEYQAILGASNILTGVEYILCEISRFFHGEGVTDMYIIDYLKSKGFAKLSRAKSDYLFEAKR